MEFLGFQTVDSKPALYHPELDLVVISDIHLGLEGSMTSKGSYVPRFQLEQLEEEIEELGGTASRILVNGDLKNQFSTSYTEKKEVERFLEVLLENFDEVLLVKGNHDTFLENTADKFGLELKDFHEEEGVLFVHGHEPLERDARVVVIGHEHPALVLEDEVGFREKVACFLHGPLDEDTDIIVMPAYSTISNGTEINNVPKNQLLSPILRKSGVGKLKATAVSREAGILEFPEVSKIK